MNEIREYDIKKFNGEPDNEIFTFIKSKIFFKIDTALHDDDGNIAIKLDLVRQDLTILCSGEIA